MDTVAPTSKSLGPSEIAKDWAGRGHPASRQYVSKLMREGIGGEKLEGAHAATLDAAWLWRTERTDFLKSKKGGGVEPPVIPAAGDGVATGRQLAPEADSLSAMLARVRGVEMNAFVRWSAAKGYDQAAEAKAYEAAAKIRANVEALVAGHHKKIGRVVDLDEAQFLLDDRIGPLRSALQSLDRELALEFFPEDPARHRRRFRAVIARHMLLSRAVARAKLPLRKQVLSHVGARAA